jgi:hypothetical protein
MRDSFDFDPLDPNADLPEFTELDFGQSDRVAPTNPATKKFQLFVKLREIKELTSLLQEVGLRSTAERQAWLLDNEPIIADMVNEFTDESLSKLQGIGTDRETVNLSVDLVTSLRQTLLLLDSLMIDTKTGPTKRT